MSSAKIDREVQALLRRAALLRLSARGFSFPQDGTAEDMRRAFARLAENNDAAWSASARATARTARAWRTADDGTLQDEYMRLFEGGVRVQPRETAYGDGRRIAGRVAELADLGGFYAAFGFALSPLHPDLPDHVSAELEFLSVLLVKEAYARMNGARPRVKIVQDAARLFLEYHLGRWLEAFARALADEDAAPPYRELAALAVAAVADECRARRARPIPSTGRLPPDEMQNESFTCPKAAACAG